MIDEGISMEHFKNIKRYFKLNNNLMTKQWGQEGYDPCAKYDFIYQCLIFNMNYLTQRADLDGAIDETSWRFGGNVSKACSRLMGKQVDKGGQMMMLYDIHCQYPRAYIHQHRLQP